MTSLDGYEETAIARIQGVRAVLFDLDGTLIDTIDLIKSSMRHATQEVLGLELADGELMKNVGIPLLDQMEIFSSEHAEQLVVAYREHNKEVHDELICGYAGVEDVLQWLRAEDVPMGIVTSKSSPVAYRGLDLFGLRGYFETIVCADDVDTHKPEPFPLLYAADALGVPIDECIYLGDSPHDMTAAVSGGAVAVAALWGAFEEEDVLRPGPAFALSDIRELESLMRGSAEEFLVERES